ncbi:uncharacterized protein LOC126615507, partial [Malus sylvestris]|uniref:uncharacterized protein LOC126615507 n=1 Tax=Malus sylvestris TaxID=3752 RepID=UPI0021AC1D27
MVASLLTGTHSYLDLSLFVSRVLSHLREKRRSTGKLGAMASSSGTGTASAISLRTMNLANIPILTGGSNYKKWRREIGLLLTLNEFDIALDIPKPVLTDQSTRAEKADAERWVRANKVALSILESAMTDTVRGGIKKHDLAIDYLNAIERKFKESQKAEISQYMAML